MSFLGLCVCRNVNIWICLTIIIVKYIVELFLIYKI